jgi:hypothetical protein
MRSNSLRTKQADIDAPATQQGPKPGDFVLGSAESRAAARAIVQWLAEKDGPQPGDIFIDLGFLAPKRAAEVYRLIHSAKASKASKGTPDRIPGEPKMWLKFPEGFDPDSLPEGAPPLTWNNAPNDLLKDLIRCYNESFRKAKQNGQSLRPEFDPDLVWNGMAYVPKKTAQQSPSKVTG